MIDLAIIGGSGLAQLAVLSDVREIRARTPYGDPSGPLLAGTLAGARVIFLARHGVGHSVPPHRINYRANLWALKEHGAHRLIAVAAVGGITPEFPPRRIVVPDQIIDYTWSREHSFFEGKPHPVTHVDFSYPYCQELRALLLGCARQRSIDAHDGATYGATQGPRLETAAEIDRMERDGCHLVGMTGMPEAGLARELGLCYASCAVVANWAAGRGPGPITLSEIEATLATGLVDVVRLIEAVASELATGYSPTTS